jgi:hypothetical protein
MPGPHDDDVQHNDDSPSRKGASRLFIGGGLFVWHFTLPSDRLVFTASVLIRGTDLELWDAEVFPVRGGRLAIGVAGIRQLIDELCRLARIRRSRHGSHKRLPYQRCLAGS